MGNDLFFHTLRPQCTNDIAPCHVCRSYAAGRDTFKVDGTNFGAAAYIADKYDMPGLGKQVTVYLDTVSIHTDNVAQRYIWADKFKAVSCQRHCWTHIKYLTKPNIILNRYPT